MISMQDLQVITESNGWGIKREGNSRIKMYNKDNTVFVVIQEDGDNLSLSIEVQSDLTNNTVIEPARYINERAVYHYVDLKQKQYANYSSQGMFGNG